MLAIKDCIASLTAQIETICIDFSLLKQDVQNLHDRMGAAEEPISSLEYTVHPLTATMCTTTDELVIVRVKLDELENHSHRNNLHFVGFSEHFGRFPP